MTEFLAQHGLRIVANAILKQQAAHSEQISIQCLQILSSTVPKYKERLL